MVGKRTTGFCGMAVRVWALCGLIISAASAQQTVTIDQVVLMPAESAAKYSPVVEANTTLKAGDRFAPHLLSEDIERLYKTGLFLSVDAELKEAEPGKATLVYTLAGKTAVRSIAFEGNDEYDDDDLRDEIEHGEGVVLDERQLARDVVALIDFYRRKGYHGTTVVPIQHPVQGRDNEVDVTFRVTESSRAKVDHVGFAGNKAFDDDELRDVVMTEKKWLSYVWSTGYVDGKMVEHDRELLQRHYRGAGYLDARVTDVQWEYDDDNDWVSLTFVIHEGDTYTVRDVKISGNTRFGTDQLTRGMALQAGERFDATLEDLDVTRISAYYQNAGYMDMVCRPRHEVRSGDRTVAVTYLIQEGTPVRIRDVIVQGNKITRDHVIRRELEIYPGDLADMRKLEAAQKRLMNLGYFSMVEIDPSVTEREEERDVRVEVQEQRTGELMLGMGFSTDSKASAMVEVGQKNFDLFNWPRFVGGGQKARIMTELGMEESQFMISFTEPWLFHRRLRLDVDAYLRERDYEEYTDRRYGGGFRLTRRWLTHWRQSAGVRLERISLSKFENNASPELLSQEGDYNHFVLSLGLTRDSRDRFVNPRRGSVLTLGTDLQAEAWGSYENIYRFDAGFTRYFPLFRKSAIKAEVSLGVVDSVSGDESDVAVFDRYYAGGGKSIRGFSSREVGPVDNQEHAMGGSSSIVGTVEFTTPVIEILSWHVFCDFGNVWADAFEHNPADLNASIGTGVQLTLPMGPMSLDFGYPIRTTWDHLDGNDGEFHFNVGYTF